MESIRREIRLISFDPGFTHFGWVILSCRDGSLVSVIKYGIYKFCNFRPSSEDITEALVRFKNDILEDYFCLYEQVVLEAQPFVGSTQTAGQLLNFNLQQIDMGVRGLLIGLGIPFHVVSPRSVRAALKISTGNYGENKKASVDWCFQKGFLFNELPNHQRQHVADAVCNAYFALSNLFGMGKILSDDTHRESQHYYRRFSERRKKLPTQPGEQTSSSDSEGSGRSPPLSDDSSD